MTPTTVTLLAQRAHRQLKSGFCSCHVTADQVAGLADGYLEALERQARIAELATKALLAWGDNHRETERRRLLEIRELCKTGG
jgi:hypothetical protein